MENRVKASVGIIMCAYNSEDTIVESIKSVIHQTFTDWHLLIIDDGSIEPLSEFLNQQNIDDSKVSVYRQKNTGLGKARNKAIDLFEQSDVQYFCFLDSDDLWHPEKLEIQFDILENCQEVGAVVNKGQVIPNDMLFNPEDYEPIQQESRGFEVHYEMQIRLLERGFYFNPVSIMVRSKFSNYYRYHENPCGQDYIAYLRLTLNAVPIAFMKLPLYFERTLENSLQRSFKSNFQGTITYIDSIDQIISENLVESKMLVLSYQARDRQMLALFWKAKRFMNLREFYSLMKERLHEIRSPKKRFIAFLKCIYYMVFVIPWK